jgi:diadenosine tetraphosphatase ApaH/serine/threonine PP2A family protein phosphatase
LRRLLEDAATNAKTAAGMLADVSRYPRHTSDLRADITEWESEGDRLVHDVVHQLAHARWLGPERARYISCTAHRARSTSTSSRTGPPRCMSAWLPPKTPTSLVFGHTHKPWVHEYGDVLFVNCGSVGKPKDGDPRGAFAILHPAAGTVDVTIERAPYDAERVADEVRAVGLPAAFADKLLVAA